MGKDGHIASIFPNSKNISRKFITAPVIRKDFKRITLGLNTINESKKILLWLNNKSIAKNYSDLAKQGKKIPINNLKKKKILIYKIS